LKARSHIYGVAVEVSAVRNCIAKVDSNAEANSSIRRLILVVIWHLSLYLHRTAYRPVYAVKHDEQRVAGGLGNSAAMLFHRRINQGAAQHLKACNRARVVKAYQAAIPDHVNVDDGDQLSTVC